MADKSRRKSPVFEESATLREPADPRSPRPRSSREAREATEKLLHEVFEESPAGTSDPDLSPLPAPPPSEEDWPSELHPLHFRSE